jgi:PAS domain S-box-containing protein
MSSIPTRSDSGIRPRSGADLRLCCPSDDLQTTAPPAEQLPVIAKHEVNPGAAAAVAVAPSLKGEDAAFEGEDAPHAAGRFRIVERRRNRQHNQSPVTTLKQMPALVVLERIPVPVLAIAHDGSFLFTNTAFAEMVGREPDEVLSLRFHQIFCRVPASESLLSVVHSLANNVVELVHTDGSIVRALMSRSALIGADDQFALAVFQDLTEQLWNSSGLDEWVDEEAPVFAEFEDHTGVAAKGR